MFLESRVDGHDETYAGIAGNVVDQQMNGLDMKIGRINNLSYSHVHLMPLNIGKGSLD